MKKIIFSIALVAITFSGFAQDESSSEYKPSKGSVTTEVGLTGGLNSTSFDLNSTANNSTRPMLKFRYFYKNDIAFRLGFAASRNAVDSTPSTTVTTTPVPTPVPGFIPSNKTFDSKTFFGVNLGVEKHFKGTERLSTFVGSDLLIGTESSYNETENKTSANASTKVVNKNANGNTYFGLALLTGADYYIAKKVYLGVELGISLVRSSQKDNVVNTETIVAGALSTSETTVDQNGNRFKLDTKLLGGVRLGYQF